MCQNYLHEPNSSTYHSYTFFRGIFDNLNTLYSIQVAPDVIHLETVKELNG